MRVQLGEVSVARASYSLQTSIALDRRSSTLSSRSTFTRIRANFPDWDKEKGISYVKPEEILVSGS
jgi:hypothetical protein